MSKVVFFSVPAYGHINFTLPLVEKMVSQGNEIIYYSYPKFKKIIEAAGARFQSYSDGALNLDKEDEGEKNDPENSVGKGMDLYNLKRLYDSCKAFYSFQEIVANDMYDNIIDHKPDFIIHDSCAPWGKKISEKAGIKAISCFSNFAFNQEIINSEDDFLCRSIFNFSETGMDNLIKNRAKHFQKVLETIIKTNLNIKKFNVFDIYNSKENLNIIFTSSTFHPYGDTFDSRYKFVGPLIKEFYTKGDLIIKRRNVPVIYCSLGTLFNNYSVYKVLFKALGGVNAEVILSLGMEIDLKKCGQIPSNFIIKKFVPQKEVLKKADLFITHGGTNGVNESLYYNVPMVVIPYAFYDHFIAAEQIEKLNTGVYIRDFNIKSSDLRAVVEGILTDSSYKENTKLIGDTLRLSGGVRTAVEEINTYISSPGL